MTILDPDLDEITAEVNNLKRKSVCVKYDGGYPKKQSKYLCQ